ncbi:Repressor protein CI, partial [Escherichia coli]|nr:Repressor protein CI [Escherichia coli]
SFRMITRLPKGRVYISSKNHSFECSLTDIEFIAKVIISCLH